MKSSNDQTGSLDDLQPVQVYPFAVEYTYRYGNGEKYYRRYTTLSTAKAAANHKVADKPTVIFEFKSHNERWVETEFRYER